jgi:hypothetical protein
MGDQRLVAMKELVGSVTATELRSAQVSAAAFEALVDGVHDESPRVRWWCVQILDHLPDAPAFDAIATALDYPVARVRRNAAHALGCIACKPSWQPALPRRRGSTAHRDGRIGASEKVRTEAAHTLACTAR